MTPEGKIKKRFSEKLSKLNHIFRFMPVQNGMGLPGLDFFLSVNGRFVAVEAKANAKLKPTPRQELTMAAIRQAGGHVFIIYDDASIDACIGSIVILANA